MTLAWLEKEIKEFLGVHGVLPRLAEISEADMADLLFDLGGLSPTPAAIAAGFLCAGVSVTALRIAKGSLCLAYPNHLGVGWSWSYYTTDPGSSWAAPRAKSACDCGAAKCNQPGHSTWCSTQQVSA